MLCCILAIGFIRSVVVVVIVVVVVVVIVVVVVVDVVLFVVIVVVVVAVDIAVVKECSYITPSSKATVTSRTFTKQNWYNYKLSMCVFFPTCSK